MKEQVPLHSVVTNAIVIKENKALIGKRASTEEHEPDKWTIPGGKVEMTAGDIWNVLEDNVIKEVQEEVGVVVENPRLVSNNTFFRKQGQHSIAMQFICDWVSGEPQALDETEEVRWVGEEELDNYNFPPNVKEYIIQGFKALR